LIPPPEALRRGIRRRFRLIDAPKRLIFYEGANRDVGDAPSVTNGENKVTMLVLLSMTLSGHVFA
jgi:hypothetical protein